MRQEPKTSIILTTYNRAKLLPRAVSSVLNQSYKNWELLIIDDCSTDNTEEVAMKLFAGDSRVRYYRLSENHGSDSYPKNFGISKAEGEFICFLDDDDEYRKDGVKILSTYLGSSGADAVYGDYMNNQGGKRLPGWSLGFDAGTLQRMNFIAMPVVMVKKKALLAVGGFDENIPKFKDWNLWLRLQKRGFRFLHVPIMVAEVHTHEDSISNRIKNETAPDGSYLPTFFSPADCEIWASKTILGEKPKLRVAVFTMTMDRVDYTKQMLVAMTQLAGYDFDWFVIDQASSDGTKELLGKHTKWEYAGRGGKIVFVPNLTNVGIAAGWNQAIDLIKASGTYDIVIKIDNDCQLMSQDWLKTMVDLFDRNRNMVLSPYVEGLEDSPGGVLRTRSSGKEPYVMINDQVLGVVGHLGGIVWAAPIEVYENFRFEPHQFMAGNKDYMISQYARAIGYTLFYCEELRCWHIDGTVGQHEKFPEYFEKHYNLEKTKA
jgi:glycosyltransferase involved in cell wall biosynthesis